MGDSTPLCKTGGLALSEYLARFSQKDDVFPNIIAENSEKFAKSLELSKKLFGSSEHNQMQIVSAGEHCGNSHGSVVNSLDGSLAGFVFDNPETMSDLRSFLKNISEFFVASIVDSENPSKVSLMLDWGVENVRR